MQNRALVLLVAASMLLVPATAVANDAQDTIEGAEVTTDENNEWHVALPADGGEWNAPVDGDVPAVNLALLPGGKLLYYSGIEANESLDDHDHLHFVWNATPNKSRARVAEVNDDGTLTTTVVELDSDVTDLFCSATTITPQGDVVATGATDWYTMDDGMEEDAEGWEGFYTPLQGSEQTMVFDPSDASFAKGPDMDVPRWYPSALQLADGDTLVASGIQTLFWPNTYNTLLERYDPETGQISPIETYVEVADGVSLPQHVLPETEDTGFDVVDGTHEGVPNLPMYPRLHTIPAGPHQGEVLYTANGDDWAPFGEHPNQALWSHFQTLELGEDENGDDVGNWSIHGRSALGMRNLGAAVPLMLNASDPEPRYLSLGGTIHQSSLAQTTSEVIDASGETITSELTSDQMTFPRWSVNSVLLPDGSVFTVGGSMHDNVMWYTSPTTSPQNAERYVPGESDPADGAWELLPPMENPRAYHSTAVLLPDASVAVGGHVPLPAFSDTRRSTTNPQPTDSTFEIYEPAYLFQDQETRPAIVQTSFDHTLPDGSAALALDSDTDQATIEVEDLENGLDSLVMVRPGAATHQYNADQLGIELTVTDESIDGGSATVTFDVPHDLAIPPGHYMLFANEDVGDGEVYPSKAAWAAFGDQAVNSLEPAS